MNVKIQVNIFYINKLFIYVETYLLLQRKNTVETLLYFFLLSNTDLLECPGEPQCATSTLDHLDLLLDFVNLIDLQVLDLVAHLGRGIN